MKKCYQVDLTEAERAVHALFCIYGDTASVERMVAEFIACAGG